MTDHGYDYIAIPRGQLPGGPVQTSRGDWVTVSPYNAPSPARSVSINLQGDVFSKEAVGGLFQRLSEELGDIGLQVRTVFSGGGGPGGAPDKDGTTE